MNTNHVKEQLLAYLCGELDKGQERIVHEHLSACEPCRKEMETINAFWSSLSMLPQEQPSDAMRERFYTMLQDTMEEQTERVPKRKPVSSSTNWFERFFPRPVLQFGFALLLVLVGGYAGFLFRQPQQAQPPSQAQQQQQVQQVAVPIQQTTQVDKTELAQLHQEVMAMNRLLTVSLLQQQSASERLKGVSLSYRTEGSDPEITQVLLQTLKYDPNVNVRLAALDALLNDREHPSIKTELVKSLQKQSSPLVQIELIDWMLQGHEKTSIDVLKKMLNDPEVNKSVKQRIQQGIQGLNS